MDKTNLSGRNWLCCRILRASAIAEADATMQVIIKDKRNSCRALKKWVNSVYSEYHNGQYLKSFNIVVFSATNKVSSESLGAIISKFYRWLFVNAVKIEFFINKV